MAKAKTTTKKKPVANKSKTVKPASTEVEPKEGELFTVEGTGDECSVRFRLFVAAVTSAGGLVGSDQGCANGAFTGKWKPITTQAKYRNVCAGTTSDGRVAVVASVDGTNAVNFIAESSAGAKGAGRWAPIENLGLPKGISGFTELALAQDADGLDNVFGVTAENTNNSIWWICRNPSTIVMKKEKVTPPGSTTPITVTVPVVVPPKKPWSNWVCINENLEGTLQSLHAANNLDGRIVLSGSYTNFIPWVTQQAEVSTGGDKKWNPWQVPGGSDGAETTGDATGVLTGDGLVSIFASTNDGILRSSQSEPGSDTWTNWTAPGVINDNVANHACNIDGDGNLYVAVLNFAGAGTQNWIYGALQTNTEQRQWTSWQPISLVPRADQLSLNYNADNSLTLFAFDSKGGTLRCKKQAKVNSTEWELEWTTVGQGLFDYSVTRDLTP